MRGPGPDRGRAAHGPGGWDGGGWGGGAWAVGIAALVALALAVWTAGEVAGRVTHGSWPSVPAPEAGGILVSLLARPGRPSMAWPAPARALIPGAPTYYSLLAATVSAVGALVWGAAATLRHSALHLRGAGKPLRRRSRPAGTGWPRSAQVARSSSVPSRPRSPSGWRRPTGGRHRSSSHSSAWARPRDVRVLTVPGPQPGRLTLGMSGRRYLAAEARQSVIVVGPTEA